MPKTKISEYSATNSSNTDIEGINIDEGCAPSGINNAIRELMVHLKEFQTGASGDAFTFAGGTLMSGTNTISGAAIISGNINSSGTNTFSGSNVMSFSGGSSASPSIYFASDTNTGIFSPAADTIAFTEGGVEAMRIDSSGDVYVGGTTGAFGGTQKGISAQSGSVITVLNGESGTALGSTGTVSNHAFTFKTNGIERMRIDTSGYFYVNNMAVGGTANLHWSSAAGQFFVTSSSRRFKHDITDYDKGLAEVMQMQPKYFVYNEEPSQKQRVGFIAEDFHDLGMTEFVEYWKDENDQDTPSEIGYSNMVAILVKAIQELKAELDTANTRLAALEAK